MRVGIEGDENIFQTIGNDPYWSLRGQTECLADPPAGNQSKHQCSCALGFMAQMRPLTEMLSSKKILSLGLSGFGNICAYMLKHLWDS